MSFERRVRFSTTNDSRKVSDGNTSVTGHQLLPMAGETLAYDADGNLSGDSIWTNYWDAENRPIRTEFHVARHTPLLLCVVLCLGATAIAADNAPLELPRTPPDEISHTSSLKQPTSLKELLALRPDQLEDVDVALIHLLCAEGLNGSEDLDIQFSLRTLNAWAAHVESETKRNQHLFDEHPERYKNSLAYFRMATLATVLVQDLRIQYHPERVTGQLKTSQPGSNQNRPL